MPIGQLSEEAAEAKDKDIKQFRLEHTRKISHTAINTNVVNGLFLRSDPFPELETSQQRKQIV